MGRMSENFQAARTEVEEQVSLQPGLTALSLQTSRLTVAIVVLNHTPCNLPAQPEGLTLPLPHFKGLTLHNPKPKEMRASSR